MADPMDLLMDEFFKVSDIDNLMSARDLLAPYLTEVRSVTNGRVCKSLAQLDKIIESKGGTRTAATLKMNNPVDEKNMETIMQCFRRATKEMKTKTSSKKTTSQFECGNCGESEKKKGDMPVCARCRRVRYCSRACQAAHWKKGDHKKSCFKPEDCKPDLSEKRAAGEMCVICLDALSSSSTSTLLCGHVLHTACRTALEKCPLCRSPQQAAE